METSLGLIIGCIDRMEWHFKTECNKINKLEPHLSIRRINTATISVGLESMGLVGDVGR